MLFGATPIELVAAIVGITLFIVILVFMAYYRTLINIASFMGINARMWAIGAKFIREDEVKQLLNMNNVSEIINEIKTEGYDIKYSEKDSIDEIEINLEKKYIENLLDVSRNLLDSLKPFVDAYMLKYDIAIIKKIIRAKNSEKTDDEIYKKIYPVHHMTKSIIDDMIVCNRIEDALMVLQPTVFGDFPVKKWNEKRDIIALDMALDKFVNERIHSSVLSVDNAMFSPLSSYIGAYIDIYNIKIILRSLNLGFEDIENYLVEGGRELPPWRLKQMWAVKNIDDIFKELETTSYSSIVKEKNLSMMEIEKIFDNYLLSKVSDISGQFSTTAGPYIRFITIKSFEIRNIKAVIRGIYTNMKKDKVLNMLVMEEA